MKKAIMILAVFCSLAVTGSAQKFALIDMEYILKSIPAYEMANEQLKRKKRSWPKKKKWPSYVGNISGRRASCIRKEKA